MTACVPMIAVVIVVLVVAIVAAAFFFFLGDVRLYVSIHVSFLPPPFTNYVRYVEVCN